MDQARAEKCYDNLHLPLIIKLSIQISFDTDQQGKMLVHVVFLSTAKQAKQLTSPKSVHGAVTHVPIL